MNTVEELVEFGVGVLERERLQAEAKRRADEAKENAEIEARLNLIVEATGVEAETLVGELGLRYRSGNVSHNFQLNYLGETGGISVEKPRGWGAQNTNMTVEFESALRAETGRASLAKFVLRAKQKYAESKAELLAKLNGDGGNLFGQWAAQRAWNDAEVQAAAVENVLRSVPTDLSSGWVVNNWQENAKLFHAVKHVADVEADVARRYAEYKKREQLISHIQRREDPRTGAILEHVIDDYERYDYVPLTRAALDVLWDAAREAGLADDAEVVARMAKLEGALGDYVHEEERAKRRAELEREAFKPFRYYVIRYSLIANSEEEGEDERVVECKDFGALHEHPDENGFYHMLIGFTIKPRNLVAVLINEVRTVDELKALSWSHKFTRETEFGRICVVPDGVELIEE